jgi:hypothetical protein
MTKEELIEFINEGLKKGYSKESIKEALLEVGEEKQKIEEALKVFETKIPPPASFDITPLKEEKFSKIPQKPSFPLKFSISKKIILPVVVLVSVALVAGASFYFYKKFAKVEAISLLPEETPFYLKIKTNPQDQQVQNFKELLKRFPNYELISEKLKEGIEKFKEENPSLKNISFDISDEIILALGKPTQETQEEPVLFIFSKPDLKKIKELSRTIEEEAKKDKNIKIEKEKYKGKVILRVIETKIQKSGQYLPYLKGAPSPEPKTEKIEVNSSFINGNFVISNNRDFLKEVIDAVASGKNLGATKPYRKLEKYLPKDYLAILYFRADISELFPGIGAIKAAEKIEKPKNLLFASFSSILDSLKSKIKISKSKPRGVVGMAIVADKEGLKSTSYYLNLKKEVVSPFEFSLKNSLAAFLPEKIGEKDIAYYMEGRNLKYQIEKFKESLLGEVGEEEKKDFEKRLEELNRDLEVDLEKEILSLFNKNYAVFLGSEPSGKKAPVLGFVAQIEDENKTKENFLKIKLPKEITDPISTSLKGAQLRAKDARIMADMAQMRMVAEMINVDEGGYKNLSCNYQKYIETKTLCDDIKELSGRPIIHSARNQYCIYAKLNEPGAYFCIDNIGNVQKTYINPGSKNYCNGKTFICPRGIGQKPETSEPEEKVGFEKETIDGLEIYSLPVLGNLSLSFTIKDKKIFLVLGEKEDLINLLKKEGGRLKDAKLFSGLFQKAPENVAQIEYSYPYGYLGLLKYTIGFFANLFAQSLTLPGEDVSSFMNAYIAPLYEFLDRGIAPYLKVLKGSGIYSWRQEEGLIIAKSTLLIEELPPNEKKAAEDFWKNFQSWLKNNFPLFPFQSF